MEPRSHEQPDLKLPAPEYADTTMSVNNETAQRDTVARPPVNPIAGANVSQEAYSSSALGTVAPSSVTSMGSTQASAVNPPAHAGAGDEYWVSRTEQVIAQTVRDPSAELEQINKLKAEYLQEKFGKTLKNSEM